MTDPKLVEDMLSGNRAILEDVTDEPGPMPLKECQSMGSSVGHSFQPVSCEN